MTLTRKVTLDQLNQALAEKAGEADMIARIAEEKSEREAADAEKADTSYVDDQLALKFDKTGGPISGSLTVPDGTANAPSLTNTGDTNTGLFFPAENVVGVSTNGLERARFDENGNLNVGGSGASARIAATTADGVESLNVRSGVAILRHFGISGVGSLLSAAGRMIFGTQDAQPLDLATNSVTRLQLLADGTSLNPATTEVTSLGSSLLRWLKIWVKDLDISGTATAQTPIVTDDSTKIATTAYVKANLSLSPLPRGYIDGLIMANDVGGNVTNNIIVGPGTCRDSTDTADLRRSVSLTKRSDANWSVGTGGGWLDTGTIGNGSYFVYEILRPDTGVVDSVLSLSPTAPNLTAPGLVPYTKFRRNGAIIRIAGAIMLFIQTNDRFRAIDRRVADSVIANVSLTSSAVTLTRVPVGLQFDVDLEVNTAGSSSGTSGVTIDMWGVGETATTVQPSGNTVIFTSNNAVRGTGAVRLRCSALAQVTARANQASADLNTTCVGWYDTRGRDA